MLFSVLSLCGLNCLHSFGLQIMLEQQFFRPFFKELQDVEFLQEFGILEKVSVATLSLSSDFVMKSASSPNSVMK